MMKKITLLLILLTVSLGYSQVLLVDFEGGAYGGTLVYQNETQGDCPQPENGVMSQEPNPVPTGNPSATAAEIITDTAGNPWQNAQLFLAAGDEIDLTGTTKTVSVLVYSTTATDILAKVVDGPTTEETAAQGVHSGGGWQTVTFDFGIPVDCGPCFIANGSYSRILFFPLWNEGGAGFSGGPYCGTQPLQTIWIDDIINLGVLGTNDFAIEGLSIFPNPTQDNWNIKTKNINMSSIQVFDMLGKNVLSLSPDASEAKIDASRLTTGLYFAQIKTASGIASIKLVKQ